MTSRIFILPALVITGVFALHNHACAAVEPLILGVFPRQNAKVTTHEFQPLAHYLTKSLKRPVKLETAADFKTFWNRLNRQRYDIVHFNQYHYLRSHQQLGYQVIAMNEEFGHATIGGALVVSKDNGFKSLVDLKGQKIIFGGGPKAMMSYIVPTYLLRQSGLQQQDYREVFAKTPLNALLAVCVGQVAAAGVGDRVLEQPIAQAKCNTDKLHYLAVSKQLAQLPWAVKAAMPQKLVHKIQSLLVNLEMTMRGREILKGVGVTRLVKAKDSDYDGHREIISFVTGEQY